MDKAIRGKIISFIEPNIRKFHTKRLANLLGLKLNNILKRKNPYLFKAKNLITASDLVKSILDAHLSSQEEGIFGGFLEELVIYVCSIFFNAKKSAAEGIDMEFDKGNIKYIVSVKSGPNWGNSQQQQRMIDNFNKAKRILRTNNKEIRIEAINGCCYGYNDKPYNKHGYLKLCGQRFWRFISNDENLYFDIIEPLGYKAKEKNEEFNEEYAKVINKFTAEFIKNYCSEDGSILWEKLLKYNSGIKKNHELY